MMSMCNLAPFAILGVIKYALLDYAWSNSHWCIMHVVLFIALYCYVWYTFAVLHSQQYWFPYCPNLTSVIDSFSILHGCKYHDIQGCFLCCKKASLMNNVLSSLRLILWCTMSLSSLAFWAIVVPWLQYLPEIHFALLMRLWIKRCKSQYSLLCWHGVYLMMFNVLSSLRPVLWFIMSMCSPVYCDTDTPPRRP